MTSNEKANEKTLRMMGRLALGRPSPLHVEYALSGFGPGFFLSFQVNAVDFHAYEVTPRSGDIGKRALFSRRDQADPQVSIWRAEKRKFKFPEGRKWGGGKGTQQTRCPDIIKSKFPGESRLD